jgi:hypothetical protein
MVEVETISTMRRLISILQLMIDSLADLKTVTIATLSQFHLRAGSHHHQEWEVSLVALHPHLQDTDLMVEARHKLSIPSPLVMGMAMARLDMLMIVVGAETRIEPTVGVEICTEGSIEGAVKERTSIGLKFVLWDDGETLILAKLNSIARKANCRFRYLYTRVELAGLEGEKKFDKILTAPHWCSIFQMPIISSYTSSSHRLPEMQILLHVE